MSDYHQPAAPLKHHDGGQTHIHTGANGTRTCTHIASTVVHVSHNWAVNIKKLHRNPRALQVPGHSIRQPLSMLN